MKKFFAEFRQFAMRGNVVDMAVGVVIGAAFKTIVDSLVNDILSPFLGLFIGESLASNSFQIGKIVIGYGAFITAVINFLIMAFVLFIIVKTMNKARHFMSKTHPDDTPKTKTCPFCKSAIPIDAIRCAHCTSELPNEMQQTAE